MKIGEKIRNLRKNCGLTQEELAGMLGLKKSAIAKYENGRVENIKKNTLLKMSDIFGCPLSFLIDENDSSASGKTVPVIELRYLLKMLRSEKNMSQADLAAELGAGLSTVAMWETGKRYPTRDTFEMLADLFNVDIDYLYGRTNIRQKVHFDGDGNMMVSLSDFEYLMIQEYRKADEVTQLMVQRSLGLERTQKNAAESIPS